jgi:hypothetical protein
MKTTTGPITCKMRGDHVSVKPRPLGKDSFRSRSFLARESDCAYGGKMKSIYAASNTPIPPLFFHNHLHFHSLSDCRNSRRRTDCHCTWSDWDLPRTLHRLRPRTQGTARETGGTPATGATAARLMMRLTWLWRGAGIVLGLLHPPQATVVTYLSNAKGLRQRVIQSFRICWNNKVQLIILDRGE